MSACVGVTRRGVCQRGVLEPCRRVSEAGGPGRGYVGTLSFVHDVGGARSAAGAAARYLAALRELARPGLSLGAGPAAARRPGAAGRAGGAPRLVGGGRFSAAGPSQQSARSAKQVSVSTRHGYDSKYF